MKLRYLRLAAVAMMLATPAIAQTVDQGSGSLNTNSNQHHVNSNNDSSTQTTNHNGDIITQQGGVVQVSPETQTVSNTSSNTTKVDTNQVTPATVSNLTTSGQDTCFGSSTGGLTLPGLGAIAGGKTVVDEHCELLKASKLLNSLGLKDAAVAILIETDKRYANAIKLSNPDIWKKLSSEGQSQTKEEELVDKYETAGLPVPSELAEKIDSIKNAKDYWYEVRNGQPMRCHKGKWLSTCVPVDKIPGVK